MPLLISLKVAAIATLITTALAVPIAYGMAQCRGHGKNMIDSLILLPLVLPPTVIGFGLLWLLGDQGPFSVLSLDIIFTWWAAVLTAVIVSFPLMYRSSLAAFEQVDTSLIGVARTLGASEWRVFSQIAIPLALPGIAAGVLLSFARALGEFGATLMLAGNIPGKTQTLPMAVYFAVEGGDLREATLWSVVTGIIALLVVGLSNQVSQQQRKEDTKKTRSRPHANQQRGSAYLSECLSDRGSSTPQQLTVDITKRLPRFTLRVQFQTANGLTGILGASGAGKSLLLRCLAGVETPDDGRIVLGDRTLYDSERGIDLPSCDRRVALLFQNYALFPHLTVRENVAFGITEKAGAITSRTRLPRTYRCPTRTLCR